MAAAPGGRGCDAMQWFETAPGTVQASVDAYLAAAAAHERAAEAARQAAVAAQALAVQVPAEDHADPAAATGGMGAPVVDAPGTGADDLGTPYMSTPGMGSPGMATTGTGTVGAGAGDGGLSAARIGAVGLGGIGVGVAGGGPWPGELLDVLVRRLPAGDLPLASLTEAELAAATGALPGQPRLVPLPHMDGMPDRVRQAAVTAGWDSLVQRGLLGGDGQPGWALAALLAVRTLPRAVTVAGQEQQPASPFHSLYAYAAGGDAVLEELVEPAGTHHFTLRSRASACAQLARLADPYGRARDSSPPLVAEDTPGTGGAGWAAVHNAIARAEHVTQVSTTRPGPAAAQWLLMRLIAGPDGLLALACRQAAGAARPANARWLSGWALQRLLLACLEVAPTPARGGTW